MAELALLVLACGLATYLWRGVGLLISRRVNMKGDFFVWVGCVAYAMIAGLTVRIMMLPTGSLAATSLSERLLACALSLVVYFVFRRNLFVGIATGFVTLVTVVSIRQGL